LNPVPYFLTIVHPVIRIAAFLVVAAFLARGELSVMLVVAAGLVLALIRLPAASWRTPLALFRRLRWLLISLLVVYGWFTPGVALWPALGVAAPTQEGLSEGLLRGGALLLIALAAQLLMLATPRPQLLAALYWLARPLRSIGVSRERLAIRLALTLEAVPQLSAVMTPALYQDLEGNAATRFGQIAARAFQGALDQAARQAGSDVDIVTAQRPPLYQWLYPLSLGLLLAWVH
jgi:energy-coupling factor transporter transmembrane protein EcfT